MADTVPAVMNTPPKAAVTPKGSKTKVAKPKKPKTANPHPKYLEMTVASINALKERNGSSRQAILKYIMSHYNVGRDPKVVNTHLKMALKRGVSNGSLKHAKGQGASGSFRVIAEKKASAASAGSGAAASAAAKKAVVPKAKKVPVEKKVKKAKVEKPKKAKVVVVKHEKKKVSKPKKLKEKKAKTPKKKSAVEKSKKKTPKPKKPKTVKKLPEKKVATAKSKKEKKAKSPKKSKK